jgi:hypothetical protein
LTPGAKDAYNVSRRGVAQPGSALEWGSSGRWFKSSRPDHFFYPSPCKHPPVMIGAPHHVKTKNFPLIKIFFIFPLIALACSLSACSLFKSASIEKQGLSAEDRAFYSTYSKKFGIRFTGTENKRLIKAIDGWMGVPYRLGGCSKSGIDCSCFVQAIYADVYGIALRRSSSEMFGDVRTVAAKELKEGDLLFLKKPGKKISHVGIYLKDKRFVHVTTAGGVVISSLHEGYYRKYFHAGGRVAQNGRRNHQGSAAWPEPQAVTLR